MNNALIGHSGFVGSTLLKQTRFESIYRSSDIQNIAGRQFDQVVCAGAPAQKWIANRDPISDKEKINGLMANLLSMRCEKLILISTVDVFKDPMGVDEDSQIDEEGLHAYGLHRRYLEKFVEENFPDYLIVRLPGLVGPGLRKNVIFDFLNKNNLGAIESRAVFQFYPMVNLWYDIQVALQSGLRLVHLTAEPISVADMSRLGFGSTFDQTQNGVPAKYDLQSKYAHLYGAWGRYQYSFRETIQAIRAYAQSEPVSVHTGSRTSS